MASGWARDGAVQEQIDASVDDAVQQARRRLGAGESRKECSACGETIPEARRKALPGVRNCVACQQEEDAEFRMVSSFNRRGNKDSQLR
ncbi:MAG TPA: DksA/TraR family C4-type zinc finger protein [Polyangiaceae bacterium]|nr:DksA/TraR family C4-type zinc finger protein [Polyangiaceae bacterium]